MAHLDCWGKGKICLGLFPPLERSGGESTGLGDELLCLGSNNPVNFSWELVQVLSLSGSRSPICNVKYYITDGNGNGKDYLCSSLLSGPMGSELRE